MNDAPTSSDSHAGQAVYSPWVLRIYDWYVLGFSNAVIWRCSSRRLLDWYDRHVQCRHLDVGVGTGWFLDRCSFPCARPDITLLDLNANSLRHCAERIARYAPDPVRGDVLGDFQLPRSDFGSIGLNYLLHCLPATSNGKSKWQVIESLAPHLADDGVLFGSTILGQGLPRNPAQRQLMALYNRKGIFGNARDSRADLERALQQRFRDVTIEMAGVVALFAARGRK